MTTLEKLNKQVEEKRLAFIETKDTKLKEKLIKEIEAIKAEFELNNLEDIQEDLKIHQYVKGVCEKKIKDAMSNKSEDVEAYSDYMTAKAMIGQYESMIKQNKKVIDQLVGALKGSMLKPDKTEVKA